MCSSHSIFLNCNNLIDSNCYRGITYIQVYERQNSLQRVLFFFFKSNNKRYVQGKYQQAQLGQIIPIIAPQKPVAQKHAKLCSQITSKYQNTNCITEPHKSHSAIEIPFMKSTKEHWFLLQGTTQYHHTFTTSSHKLLIIYKTMQYIH